MAETRWTPGPWKADIRRGCVVVYPANEHHESLGCAEEWAIHCKVGRLVRDDQGRPLRWEVPEEVVANARLIAAAPDLYEALELVVEKLREYADMDRWSQGEGGGCMSDPDEFIREAVEKGEAALRKARGETNE